MTPPGPVVRTTEIAGLVVIEARAATDERGTIRELFRASDLAHAGIEVGRFLQINLTETVPGAIRGLHGEGVTKLVSVVEGAVFGAWVDVRPNSPSIGLVVTRPLARGDVVVVPSGVCNGFQSLGDRPSQYVYCFDAEWAPAMPGAAVNPLDPELGIRWPVPPDPSLVSVKDRSLPSLQTVLRRARAS